MTPTLPQQTEAEFQAAVLELAELLGWRCYHTHDSRRSHAGFPDLVLVRPPELLFAELKSDKGRTTPQQRTWLSELGAAGQDARVWRPSDWPEIEKRLQRRR